MMKLTIKTLQNSTFKVDIEPDKTVRDLKNVIEKEQGKDYPSGSQKLIYNGKILTDDSKLAEYEFDEKKFVVLMTTRPPPVPKPVATTEQTSSSAKQTDNTIENKPATTSTATTTTPAQSRSEPRPQPQPPSSGAQGAAAAALADMSALSMGEPQIGNRLASLMSQPHFRQMQDLIQQSPHLLSSTIESLAASDPEMYNFISENPDIFVSALNHTPLAGAQSSDSSAAAHQRQGGASQQPVVDQLLGNVTEHDKQAIERLKELGFSEYLAVQAYMACDKDEQLAANLLFQMD